MVFQNPFDTLNPSMTVGRQIIRALEIFREGARKPSAATGCWNFSTS
jgi:peptide/nickel transport system ATP-binding protein